ncbi:MAG: hypothetical protein ACR2GT_14475 [Gaiellaceae bacterium]
MSEQFRTVAQDDSDFDPIRDDPTFKELTGSVAPRARQLRGDEHATR